MLRKFNLVLKTTLLVSPLMLGVPANVYATNSASANGLCTVDTAAGTGHCEGNYDDIRNYTTDPSRFASFIKSNGTSNYLFFQMQINKKYYMCSGNQSMLDAWNTAMASGSHLWFGINFTLNGQCTNLELDVSSVYR